MFSNAQYRTTHPRLRAAVQAGGEAAICPSTDVATSKDRQGLDGFVWCGMLCYAMLCYDVVCYAMLCYAMLCRGVVWYAMMRCGIVWYGVQ